MKLDDFVGKNYNSLRNFDEINWKLAIFYKNAIFSKHVGTDFFFKNDARKLKFGLGVPLYSI